MQANSNFAYWNFLHFFFSIIFDPQVTESMRVEPVDTEG